VRDSCRVLRDSQQDLILTTPMNTGQRPWAHVSRRHVIPDPHAQARADRSTERDADAADEIARDARDADDQDTRTTERD
jgi:hypothetical protein